LYSEWLKRDEKTFSTSHALGAILFFLEFILVIIILKAAKK